MDSNIYRKQSDDQAKINLDIMQKAFNEKSPYKNFFDFIKKEHPDADLNYWIRLAKKSNFPIIKTGGKFYLEI